MDLRQSTNRKQLEDLNRAIGTRTDPATDDNASVISILKRVIPPNSVQFNLVPTYGISQVRDRTTTANDGDISLDSNGEFLLSTGATANSTATLETRERGQYRSGSQSSAAIGIRVPTDPVDDQVGRWGYFDDDNGFGFGIDATGPFIFRRFGGSDTIVRQADWNLDTLDGSGSESNTSGAILDLTNGNIFQVWFWWYGYGSVRWEVEGLDRQTDQRRRISIHRNTYSGSLSLQDPNQPLTVEIDNGAAGGDFDVYVGGRKYAISETLPERTRRAVEGTLSEYTLTTAEGVWEPLVSVRSKPVFPAGSSRRNSVRIELTGLNVLVDDRIEARITILDTVTADSAAGWVQPTGWSTAETATEIQQQDGSLAVTAGETILTRAIDASFLSTSELAAEETFVLSDGDVATLWVRPQTGNTTIAQFARLGWDEQW